MTAATAQAPTEAEIHALLDEAFAPAGGLNTRGVIEDAIGGISGLLDRLYDVEDMRPSELAAFDRAIGEAVGPVRDRYIEQLVDELREAATAATVRFAAEQPDAPRRTDPAAA